MRHSLSISISSLFSLAATLMLLAGCGGSPDTNGAPAPVAPAPTTPATGPDGGSPTATTPRTLIDVPFLGGVAPENRVTDPAMSLEAGNNWFFTELTSNTALPHVTKAALANGPMGQTALFVPAATNAKGTALGAIFKIPAGAYTATVWFGSAASATTLVSVSPITLTFDENGAGNPRAWPLALDTSADGARDIDGMHWVRYTAAVTPEIVAGWGYIYIEDTDAVNDVWVTGAEVLAATKSNMITQAPTPARPLRLEEARWLRAAESARKRPIPILPNGLPNGSIAHRSRSLMGK